MRAVITAVLRMVDAPELYGCCQHILSQIWKLVEIPMGGLLRAHVTPGVIGSGASTGCGRRRFFFTPVSALCN